MPGTKEHTNTLVVKVSGTTLSDEVMTNLASAWVDDSLGAAAMFVLSFHDPYRSVLTDTRIEVGAKVSLSVTNDSTPHGASLLEGEVTALEAEFGPHGTQTVVRGFDILHRLFRGRGSKSYLNVAYSDVVRKVAGEAGVAVGTIESTSGVHDVVTHHACSEWQFVSGLAREVGYELAAVDGKLHFRKPAAASAAPSPGTFDSSDALQLVPGENLIRFRATVTSAEQVASVQVRGWDPKRKQAIVGTAQAEAPSAANGAAPRKLAATFGSPVFVTGDTTPDTQAAAEATAKAIAEEIGGSAAEIDGVAVGNTKLRAGAAVSLGLTGAPFDGKYTLTATRHAFDPEEGYTTAFTASGRSLRSLHALGGHDDRQRASGPRIPGAVIGIVTSPKDPEKRGRVKVKLPCLADDYESDWARVAYAGAGPNYGAVFIPEVGDEVLVVFGDGDLRRPFVIGGLHNGVDKPFPDSGIVNGGSGKVDSRGIVSRTGQRVILHDADAGTGISLITGKEPLQVLLDEKTKTVKITSTGDVVIEAQGGVTVKATKNIDLSGQQIALKAQSGVSIDAGGGNLTAKGVQVDVNGSAGVKVKGAQVSINGDATTEVKGGAMLDLQGALVKIN